LLGWFNKSAQRSGLLAVAIEPEAIKFAHVRAANRERPLRRAGGVFHARRLSRRIRCRGDEGARTRPFHVYYAARAADYQILLVESPKVPTDELKAAIRWRIKDLLEYHIDDATVDVFEVRAEGDAKGSAKAMYAVATPNEVVQKRIALFQGARVPLKVIDIPEMAQRNIAALFESPDKATAMLAFSSWGGMLTISFRGELLLTRRLEVTSVQLGQREHGDHYRERVATEITRSLDIFDRQRLSVGVGELLLAPLPQDPELEQFLRTRLYVPVVARRIAASHGFCGRRRAHCRGAVGVFLPVRRGLAGRGEGAVSQQINLFNPLFLEKKKYFSAVTMTQALGLIVLGMAVFYVFAFWQDRNLARQIGESGRAYEQQKQQFAKIAAELSPEKREAQLDQDLRSIEAAIACGGRSWGARNGRSGWSRRILEYLRAFARQTVQGLWLTSIQIAEGGGQLTMSGRALQADLVPVLIGRLKQESVLRGRPLEAWPLPAAPGERTIPARSWNSP